MAARASGLRGRPRNGSAWRSAVRHPDLGRGLRSHRRVRSHRRADLHQEISQAGMAQGTFRRDHRYRLRRWLCLQTATPGRLGRVNCRRHDHGARKRPGGDRHPCERVAKRLQAKVDVPWASAIDVHREKVLPRWVGLVERSLPNTGAIGPDCLGALVSLTYNRGASFGKAGARYREMRNIKAHMAAKAFGDIPDEFRSMKRLWPDMTGLQKRREREARLFERGLAALPSA